MYSDGIMDTEARHSIAPIAPTRSLQADVRTIKVEAGQLVVKSKPGTSAYYEYHFI
jgi:hypothetical protein